MAAGCTAVVKPSELTPGTTLKLGELLMEAGIPDGVVNIFSGYGDPVGKTLSESMDVDMISFTGSTMVGKQIVAASQHNLKKVSLELGGKIHKLFFQMQIWMLLLMRLSLAFILIWVNVAIAVAEF